MESTGAGSSVPDGGRESTSEGASRRTESDGAARNAPESAASGSRPDRAESGALTSLVSFRHIGESVARCERVDFDFVNMATGERISGRCKAYRCEYCGPRKLQLLELCLVAALPERFITLTWAPEDRDRRRKQVAWLMQSLRRDGMRCEIAWVTEENPRGTGHHIHALQKGDFIPQATLQAKWGGRIAHVAKLDNVGGGVSAYMLKVQRGSVRAAGYALKQQTGERQRPVNITRNFFDGRKLGDVRDDVKGLLYGERDEVGVWARTPRCES